MKMYSIERFEYATSNPSRSWLRKEEDNKGRRPRLRVWPLFTEHFDNPDRWTGKEEEADNLLAVLIEWGYRVKKIVPPCAEGYTPKLTEVYSCEEAIAAAIEEWVTGPLEIGAMTSATGRSLQESGRILKQRIDDVHLDRPNTFNEPAAKGAER